MEEKTIYFKMEMDVNEDYLRETWDVYPKVKRATREIGTALFRQNSAIPCA